MEYIKVECIEYINIATQEDQTCMAQLETRHIENKKIREVLLRDTVSTTWVLDNVALKYII